MLHLHSLSGFMRHCICLPLVVAMNTDIDECVQEVDPCSKHAYCSNEAGSYTCACQPGFVGTGEICVGK